MVIYGSVAIHFNLVQTPGTEGQRDSWDKRHEKKNIQIRIVVNTVIGLRSETKV